MALVKRKDGPVQPRPTQIGNTFIGSTTDLTQYGYYNVTNPAPNDAPEGQRYVDSGNGTYDEAAFTYTADWVLEQIPPPPRPEPITKMTHLSFLRRFTAAERSALRAAAETDPILDDAMYLFERAQEIDTTDVDTQQFTGYMIMQGLLAPERQVEVLAAVNQDELDAWDAQYGTP